MSIPMNSLYSLTWGDYGTSLVSAIQLLRCHGDLVDCTLAAGGRSFPAHKIVLCAASPFLLDLLKNTPCKHPVVMLAGVHASDLEALLEFVYRGEVSVDHSQLPSLLQAAQCLNIQGLAPQTIQKDDYATQIQLQQMLPQQHHVKAVIDDQEQLIATINAPQQTVHAQVVEDLNPIVAPQNQKEPTEVMNQFLPARKRKPRAKKQTTPTAPKVLRIDGMENVMTTPTTGTIHMENGDQNTQTIRTPLQSVKAEIIVPDNIVTVTTAESSIHQEVEDLQQQEEVTPTTPNNQTTTGIVTSGTTTPSKSGNKSRARSQSEQPATCPICYAVIRQSRNLRRHLELRHFAKPGVKKERKAVPSVKKSAGSSTVANTSTNTTTVVTSTIPQVQTVQTLHTLQTVQVKKEQTESIGSTSSSVTPVTLTVAAPQQQQQQQQQQHHQQQQQHQHHQPQQQQQQQQQHHHHQTTAIIDQSGNITHSGNGQQQIVTQTENTDGTTSLSIAQVQTLQGHQLTLSNMNQVNIQDY